MPQEKFMQELAEYRKLGDQKKQLEAQQDRLKKSLLAYVEANGKWEDDQGYARLTNRKAGWKVSAEAVYKLSTAWSQSQDPTTQTCGVMLAQELSETKATTYLQIK